ncbi:MAG TPA: dTDP-4-dehydrorhamnose reductase [Bacteroidales bacterium]|nr:MAG: dTDP-4-dehydrorhamnose reductase [Bacteroidetes bacterium GWE2_42_24]OFY31686.1 MAG: dTDP-4-dehydrorhamnose reductase [Bacteroidetes bacterium GWF2_43_11]HAQ65787.1 dTDP-4-dehydrorhamnose reductase [Bacteroidales bacterium]HBZ67048.1 dTDP-4-dehydrorhamnose reductase [Bacteroidales bacterium]
MKQILVTGGNGQLGSEIKKLAEKYPELKLLFTDLDLDITRQDDVKNWLEEHPVQYIINCAAYTAVDKAENDFDTAMHVNGMAPGILATEAIRHNARLIHISTDYVFDGTSSQPYLESDCVNPRSKYGQSKLKGEQAILEADPSAIIIRTSWLYSSVGNNFVKTIRKYGSERGQLRVVYDQTGGPTYAADLALVLLDIVSLPSPEGGIYHYANEGVISWYDFAQEICRLSNITCHIEPIRTGEYPLPAPRPGYSVFDKSKIKTTFGITIPWWRDSLARCITILNEQK